MQYSSFWNMYLYRPDSSVYILPWEPEIGHGRTGPHRASPAPPASTPQQAESLSARLTAQSWSPERGSS